MKIAILIIISVIATVAACSSNGGGANEPAKTNQTTNSGQAVSSNDQRPANSPAAVQPEATSAKLTEDGCGDFNIPGKIQIKKQTFPVDFKPFNGSCFVTFGSKVDMLNEKDVPRGSTFYVFKEGKQVFAFPDAFGGQEACWVDAVSFKDLNGDGLTDIIIAGSCLAAKNSFPANAVYVNTGTGFTTNEEANTKLDDFKSIKEIEAYVKSNVSVFF